MVLVNWAAVTGSGRTCLMVDCVAKTLVRAAGGRQGWYVEYSS